MNEQVKMSQEPPVALVVDCKVHDSRRVHASIVFGDLPFGDFGYGCMPCGQRKVSGTQWLGDDEGSIGGGNRMKGQRD